MTLFCTISGCIFLCAISMLAISFVVTSAIEIYSYRRPSGSCAPAARIRRELEVIRKWCLHDIKIVRVCDRISSVLDIECEEELDDIMPIAKWQEFVSPITESQSKLQAACGAEGVGDRNLL